MTKNINLRVKVFAEVATGDYVYLTLWLKKKSWLFCDHILCYVHVLNWDDVHQSLMEKRVSKQSSSLPKCLLNAAQLCSMREIQMTETGKVKVQKSSIYFVHNLNKLQQVKLSAVWILAISLTILVYNHY